MVAHKQAGKNTLESDDVLQAVIVADSFNKRFMPICSDMPRCLIPVCNVPLIEYSLEALAMAGMQEIIVVCCAHSDMIVEYLNELLSMGDVLRDLDTKQVLKSDFVLLSGDVVTNVDIAKVLEEHKKRKLVDKNCIMTMVMRAVGPGHRSRQKGEECLYALDAVTNACLYYAPLPHFPRQHFKHIPLENLHSHEEIQLRSDLMDAQIDVCSLEVPALFTENFDYQDMRKDFVKGILESDLLGKTIYCHIAQHNGYAKRVTNTASYDAVSQDVLGRWVYPFTLDLPMFGSKYELSGTSIYKGAKVSLARSVRLKGAVVVGAETSISEHSVITNSVIGRNCHIGSHCVLQNVYVWDNSVIGDGVQMTHSIVAYSCRIGDQATIGRGCIVGAHVIVPNATAVPEHSRLYSAQATSAAESGSDQKCSFLEGGYEEDEEADIRNILYGEFARDMTKALLIEEAIATESEPDDDESEAEYDEEAEKKQIALEINATFERAIIENHSPDIAGLELNTLKMALNISFHDLRAVVLPNLMDRLDKTRIAFSVKETFTKWAPLIMKFVHDAKDQLDCVSILVTHCVIASGVTGGATANGASQMTGGVTSGMSSSQKTEANAKTFSLVIQHLYQLDILDEEVVLKWYADTEHDAALKHYRLQMSKFIDWLNEAEEESDDE